LLFSTHLRRASDSKEIGIKAIEDTDEFIAITTKHTFFKDSLINQGLNNSHSAYLEVSALAVDKLTSH
tara:strand:- start:207 stop:410 length:204 start_codon:yes stop_codon:yes gene_type:complete